MKAFLFLLMMTSIPGAAMAKTWGEIAFLPKEPFWDEELEIYLLGDSYNLLIFNPDKPGLDRILQFSCSLDEFGDNPDALYYDISVLFRGLGADAKAVSARPGGWGFEGQVEPVRLITPTREFSGGWSWFKYEADYLSGSPKLDGEFVWSYGDFRNVSSVRVITLGEDFTLDMGLVQGYLQGFDRKCQELLP